MNDECQGVAGGRRGDGAETLTDIGAFSKVFLPTFELRPYQVGPARAIAESVDQSLGRQFVVVFSRQAGKDELLAQLLAYPLARNRLRRRNSVLAAPTFRPQAALSRDRLLARLDNPLTAGSVKIRDGYAVMVGKASARFLSPRKARTPAVKRRISCSWRTKRKTLQSRFGTLCSIRWRLRPMPPRSFLAPSGVVKRCLRGRCATSRNWSGRMASAGFGGCRGRRWRSVCPRMANGCEPGSSNSARCIRSSKPNIAWRSSMARADLFPPQPHGDAARRSRADGHSAEPGKRYALLVDVAGEEEGGAVPNRSRMMTRRDSTALTVVEIVEERGATFGPADRIEWSIGWRGPALVTRNCTRRIVHLARVVWRASVVVVDATGVGAGLASFLTFDARRAIRADIPHPGAAVRLQPVEQERIGVGCAGADRSGRLREYRDDSASGTPEGRLTATFLGTGAATTYETRAGSGQVAALAGAGRARVTTIW